MVSKCDVVMQIQSRASNIYSLVSKQDFHSMSFELFPTVEKIEI